MKYFYKAAFAFFLLPLFSIAQSNYKPGYVVSLKGDTIHGLIDFKKWDKNPQQISFKKDANTAAQTFNTTTISAFAVTGYELYRKFTGKISEDPVANEFLTHKIDSSFRVDTVFLRVAITGKNVTLYQYNDTKKPRYFISETGMQPTELINRLYMRYMPNSSLEGIASQDIYREQLRDLAAKYQPQVISLISQIDDANYYLADLKKIAFKINGADNADLFVLANQNKGSRFYLGAAVNGTSTHFAGLNPLSIAKSSSSFFPAISGGLDVFANKNIKSLIFRLDAFISAESPSFSYQFQNFTTVFKVQHYMVGINPQMIYNFYNTPGFKLYGSAGVTFNVTAHTNTQYYNIANGTGTITNLQTNGALTHFAAETYYSNLTTRIGFVINDKIDVYFGYNFPADFGDKQPDDDIVSSSFHAGVNFLFGK